MLLEANNHRLYMARSNQQFFPAKFVGSPFRLLTWVIIAISFIYTTYTLSLLYYSSSLSFNQPSPVSTGEGEPTALRHIVFGIAASENLWKTRKNYIKLWYHPNRTRGVVWLDKPVSLTISDRALLPPIKISSDTTRFPFTNPTGHRSAIRISRIISETLALNFTDVRWFVMCDDDTVFLPDNLVGVLADYDHRQYYYIGTSSESHYQNINFSNRMAYGGGGFAISHALAVLLSKNLDSCIHRYPTLYGSDERIQACMAELGVPLTRHSGFHQYDVYGEIFGLLAAHPVVPLVSFHHLDLLSPVFPKHTRVGGLKKIFQGPVSLDSAGVMQQSICYDVDGNWTVGVAWGYSVQIVKGVVSPRTMEIPIRTFLHWSNNWDNYAYAFTTRGLPLDHCKRPIVYYLMSSMLDEKTNMTVTKYGNPQRLLFIGSDHICDETPVEEMVVYKLRDPDIWKRTPRRNCCKVEKKNKKMNIHVGVCRDGDYEEMMKLQ
ncbi:Glycosyltransferase, family GT31 [Zostera marina]|uniref:Glycosyltransferase, family GT31 n=1 Tax=Zostera marina TaxID=29655 RepID=A0A0K9Q338_ZOSMR|nr:Glycosyltransferase, family GT31 [Zostera marina]